MEDQRDDRSVDQAAPHCRFIALDAPAGAPPAATGGEDAVALFCGEAAREAAAGCDSCGCGGSAEMAASANVDLWMVITVAHSGATGRERGPQPAGDAGCPP